MNFLKYILSIFIMTQLTFADDLYIKVNFSDIEDIQHSTSLNYYNSKLSQWNFQSDSPQNNKSKLLIYQAGNQTQGSNCWQYYCSPNWWTTEDGYNWAGNTWLTNFVNSRCAGCNISEGTIVQQTCNGIALGDSAINIEQLVVDKINSTDSNFVAFIPKIVIKRGSFSVKKGNVGGDIINNYMDINILSRMLVRIKDANASDYKKSVLDYIKNNLNIKNWKYTHFKNGLSESSGHYNYYLTQAKSMIDILYADTTVEEGDKYYLEYLREIFNLGLSLENSYLSGVSASSASTVSNDACIKNTDWNSQVNNLNNAIANNTSDSFIKSFMKRFSLDKSLIKFNKVAYEYSYTSGTTQICEGNSCDGGYSSCAADESCYSYCNCHSAQTLSTTYPILKKIYGYKVLTQENKEWGSYARTIKFDSSTTVSAPLNISIDVGTEGAEAVEATTNFGETLTALNTYNTTPSVSSGSTVDQMAATVNLTNSINRIENDCKTQLDEKFSGNMVFIDQSTLVLGNNELMVKDNFNSVNPIKLSSVITSPVYEKILNDLRSKFLIMDLNDKLFTAQRSVSVDASNNIVDATDSSASGLLSFPDIRKPLRDLTYYYLWSASTDSTCNTAMNNKSTTTPFVLMSNSASDLDGYTGDLTNIPNQGSSGKYNQYTTSSAVTVVNTTEDGYDRGSDGETDAEIEKRLDLNIRSGRLAYGEPTADPDLKDKPLFPNNMFVFSYSVGYKPADINTFNTYGPVGPFWDKTEKIIESSYAGCDQPVSDGMGGTIIPSETSCINKSCTQVTCTWKEELRTPNNPTVAYVSVKSIHSPSLITNASYATETDIMNYYVNTLRRYPDPTSFNYWITQVNANAWNLTSLNTAMRNSVVSDMNVMGIFGGVTTANVTAYNNKYFCGTNTFENGTTTTDPLCQPATAETITIVDKSSTDTDTCNTVADDATKTNYNVSCSVETPFNDGTYKIYNETTNMCTCNSGSTGTPLLTDGIEFDVYPKVTSSLGLKKTKYNKYCYLVLEDLKANPKKIKWHFEPQKRDSSEISILGYSIRDVENIDTNSTESVTTQWGGWTQTDWVELGEVTLSGYSSDHIGPQLEWLEGQPELNCNWNTDFTVNGKTYPASSIKNITTADLTELASYTEGIKFAKEQLYTLNNEKRMAECLRNKDTANENSIPDCIQSVYSQVTGNSAVSTMSKDNFSTHFNNNVINYYLKANQIGFGRYFVVKPSPTTGTITPTRKVKSVFFPNMTDFLSNGWSKLKTTVFKPKVVDKNNLQNIDIFWEKEAN